MSLINQMLRDLESRRAQAQGPKPSGALDNLSWPSKPGMPSGNVLAGLHSVNWMRLGGITAAFAVLLAGYLWYSRGTPPDTASQTVAQAPAVPQQTAPESSPAPAVAAATETPAPAAAQPAPIEAPSTPDGATPVAEAPPREEKPAGAVEAAPPREPVRAEKQPPAAPRIKKPSAQGPAQLAERAYQEAVEALQNGKIVDAQQSLREALAREPLHHKSRELLTEIYLRTGQTSEAENLLAAGAMLDPRYTLFGKLHARLLAQRGDISGALQVLQRGLTGAAGDAEYHALLGALYQRAADHGQAVSAYQAALHLEPSQGVWWMGLAISLEAQQSPDEALRAYRRAHDSGNLTGAALEFVQRKINRLEAQTPAP
ncbi:MAG: tetratricopeptide repeat protein [Gammaproteobacteria bacterium]|nr:tetratricopeptide repeat protein [Gammaproteobacteria bacterium]